MVASVSGNFGFRIFDFGFEESMDDYWLLKFDVEYLCVGHSELVSGFIA